jgi:hypothetical protein
MPAFNIHRVYACAHKIAAITGTQITSVDGVVLVVGAEYITRYSPVVGGYYYLSEEGHEGYKSASDFERDVAVVTQ